MAPGAQHSDDRRTLKGVSQQDLDQKAFASLLRLVDMGADPLRVAVAFYRASMRLHQAVRPATNNVSGGAHGHRPGA